MKTLSLTWFPLMASTSLSTVVGMTTLTLPSFNPYPGYSLYCLLLGTDKVLNCGSGYPANVYIEVQHKQMRHDAIANTSLTIILRP